MSPTLEENAVQVVEAIYENGVFRPLSPPALAEHARVRLTVVAPPKPAATPDANLDRPMTVAERARNRIKIDPEDAAAIALDEFNPENAKCD